MNIIEVVMIGVGLSMDAFAVSIGKGLNMGKIRKNEMFWIALFFGGFQALMPVAGFRELFILAVATSIDALAVGVTFSFLSVNLLEAVTVIGSVTFAISLAGVAIGSRFGDKLKEKAEIMGGLILIILGCKILIQHLFF